MVERRELITICRQIGTMMEVGVDFLRLTRSLREQTDNPRLLELYDQLEHDMRMGENMADAIAKAPDVFSPFAVSLIRQGEARGDIEGAWHRLADFLKQEAQQDKDLGLDAPLETDFSRLDSIGQRATGTPPVSASVADWAGELRRLLALGSAFSATTALIWAGAGANLVAPSVLVPLELLVGAAFLGIAAWKPRPPRAAPKKLVDGCSFCGQPAAPGETLSRSSLVKDAAICASCAAALGQSVTLSEEAKKQSALQNEMARDFATDFPARFSDRASHQIPDGVAPEFEIEDDSEGGDTPHQEKRFQL